MRGTRDVEQVGGVFGGVGAGNQHEVVARTLTFTSHGAPCDPRKRVEPQQRHRCIDDELRQAVATTHVCKFVQQDGADPCVVPVIGFDGQHHGRPDHAAGNRHGHAIRAQEA